MNRDRNSSADAILAAALRWHHAREARMVIGAQQRKYQQLNKDWKDFGGSHPGISAKLTAAKGVELAAARLLAKACAKSQEIPTIDIQATEVGSRWPCLDSHGITDCDTAN